MKHLVLILILTTALQGQYMARENPAPADSVLEQDHVLEQWVADLEPVCEFRTTEPYPEVIPELFDRIMEQRNAESPDQRIVNTDLRSVVVYGTQEEFCAVYTFSGEQQYRTESGNMEQEPLGEMTLQVRMRQKDSNTYEMVAQGGGPIAYGLEQTGLTLEDIR